MKKIALDAAGIINDLREESDYKTFLLTVTDDQRLRCYITAETERRSKISLKNELAVHILGSLIVNTSTDTLFADVDSIEELDSQLYTLE